jgi:hypothetical protein
MEFSYWEIRSLRLPKGPLYGICGFLVGLGIVTIMAQLASGMTGKKEVKFSGPTLPELEAFEKVVASGDVAKIDTAMKKDGVRMGADVARWNLVRDWKNATLTELYRSDLLTNVRGQIETLKKQIEAEKAAKAGGAAAPAPSPAAAPAKQ